MRLEFRVLCDTFFGQNVYVVGNHPDLGNWDPTKGKRMDCKSDSKWRVSFEPSGPPPLNIKYKYCVLNDYQEGGGIPFWEPGQDRETTLASTTTEITCNDTWGTGNKVSEVIKGGFPGHLYCSPMPYSTMFDPQQSIYNEWKAINPDCIVILPHREECLNKTNGLDLLVKCGKDAYPSISYSIDDFGVPSHKPSFILLIDRITKQLSRGESVIVQSHAGIGRTGLLLACLIKRAKQQNSIKMPNDIKVENVDDIIKLVRETIRGSLQAEKQSKYVRDF